MIDREAYIVLNMLSGIGPARLATLLSVCGTRLKSLPARSTILR